MGGYVGIYGALGLGLRNLVQVTILGSTICIALDIYMSYSPNS